MSEESYVMYDFDPNNLPPEFLQAVGLVAASAAQTESVVQDFIGSLIQIDHLEAIALTAQMAAPLRDQIARSLIALNGKSDDVIDQVDDLLDAIAEATNRRNEIVHTSFARHPGTGEVFSIKFQSRGSLKVLQKPVAIDQLMHDAALIYNAGMNLMKFMMETGLTPLDRTKPVRAPLDRSKKAREARRRERS